MNEKEIIELMDERLEVTGLDLSFDFEDYLDRIIELLGDDEGEILEFMEAVDEKYAPCIDEFYEELIEKFPSDEMEEAFERFR